MAPARVHVSFGAAVVLALVTSAATPLLADTGTYALDPSASAVDFTVYASKIFKFKRRRAYRRRKGYRDEITRIRVTAIQV